MTRNRQRRKSSIDWRWIALAWILIATSPTRALPDPGDAPLALTQSTPTDPDRNPPPQDDSSGGTPVVPDEPLSDAERIARLERQIEAEQIRLQELEADLADPDSEYEKADAEFKELDRQLEKKNKELEVLKRDGPADQAMELEEELQSIEKQWKLARERFALAIEERRALAEQIATLEQKLKKDREALGRLKGLPEPKNAPKSAKELTEERQHPTEKTSQTPALASTVAPEVTQHLGSLPDGADTSGDDESDDPELRSAEAEAKTKEKAAQEAKEIAESITSRIEDLGRLIEQEQSTLARSRKKADLSHETQRALELEYAQKVSAQAPATELEELRLKVTQAAQRFSEARTEVGESTDRLNQLQAERASLQKEQIQAVREAEQKRVEAVQADEKLQELRNPFSPRNLLEWLIDHGPKLLLIVLGMVALQSLSKLIGRRMIRFMATSRRHGTQEERENRAQTLVGVFQNATTVTIVLGGALMMLEAAGVNVTVLMGGVAVVGLAVAFGAQNLIRDYFSGFVMLLENQYMVNDVVKIGSLSGQVERITLRITVLRDLEGVVHFIPNGQVSSVSNMTHGWSRALFDIAVAYKEDVDWVMNVLIDVGRQLRQDPAYSSLILEDPTMLGVDSLGDSAVVIKFYVKTRPLQQWSVKRELLRRIKNRFDQLGIEIPFPHRTVLHRNEDDGSRRDTAPPRKQCA